MKKFYVVWQGQRTGIFETWAECKAQVDGIPTARYKSFPTREEAEIAFARGHQAYIKMNAAAAATGKKSSSSSSPAGAYDVESIAVDGAWNTATGYAEYQGVYVRTGERIFHQGPFADASNNIVEFLALVHALAYLHQRGSTMPVYSDSQTAISWLRKKHCKTTREPNQENAELFKLIERAETWLHTHTYTNPVRKWLTDKWGEIPADFGRK